jgi:hypothetical protein
MQSFGIVVMLTLVAACTTTQRLQSNVPPQGCPAISPDQVRIFASPSELDNLVGTQRHAAVALFVVDGVPLNDPKTRWHSVATLTPSPSLGPVVLLNGIPVAAPGESVATLREKAAALGANGVLLTEAGGGQGAVAVQYGECTTPEGNTKKS